MAVSRSLKNAVVTMTDLTGAEEFIVTLEDGDFSCNVPNPFEHVQDRGAPGVIIDGLHEDVTWTMTADVTSFTADPSIVEVCGGLATSWGFGPMLVGAGAGDYSAIDNDTSLQDAATAVKFFQMRIAIADPAGGATETLFLLNNICSLTFQEGMPDKWSISSTCAGYSGAQFLANIESA